MMNPQFWKNKKVLVTGHTGFKGGWLTFWLSQMGAKVTGVSLEPNTQPNIFNTLKLSELCDHQICDLRDFSKLNSIFQKSEPEIVFHLAAQPLVLESYRSPVETYATNVMGTIHVMEACRHLKKSPTSLVVSTTDKVYENRSQLMGYVESDRLGGKDPYSNSKACTELAIASYRDSFFSGSKDSKETLVISARAGNVFGGGDWSENRIIPDAARAFSENKSMVLRHPQSIRPWQFVAEPLMGYIMLAEKNIKDNSQQLRWDQAWNFGPADEDCVPVETLAKKMAEAWGDVSQVTPQVTIEVQKNAPHEASLLKLDSTRAMNLLGWKRAVNVYQGLKMTAEWYKAFYSKASTQTMRELTHAQICTVIKGNS